MKYASLFAKLYREELFDKIVPFWLAHSPDETHGGYFNFLSNKGDVIDSDKSIVLQAQQSFAFSKLHEFNQSPEAIKYAEYGVDFLSKFNDKIIPKMVDATGRLVKKSADILPEIWVVLATNYFIQVIENEQFAGKIEKQFAKIFKQRDKEHQKAIEAVNGERLLKNIEEISMLVLALISCKKNLSAKFFEEKTTALIHELQTHFYEPRAKVLLANVHLQGGFCECSCGRKISPKETFEALSVFLELAEILNDKKLRIWLMEQAQYLLTNTWDEHHGGYFNYLDFKGLEINRPEANYKKVATHLAALRLLLQLYATKKDENTAKQFLKVHDYTLQHFTDAHNLSEWHSILNRHGEPLVKTVNHSAFTTVGTMVEIIRLLEKF